MTETGHVNSLMNTEVHIKFTGLICFLVYPIKYDSCFKDTCTYDVRVGVQVHGAGNI